MIFVRVLFNQFSLKMTENDQSSNACQSFRINVKAIKLFRTDSLCNVLFEKLNYIWVDLSDFREGRVEKLG